MKPELLSDVSPEFRADIGEFSQYWGDQPFTSGPVYVGAFVLFLAILGLFVVRTPLKWALLAGTLLSIALSWGHNMMWLTDLFIDYFPLYNKFRTVSSILVVAEFTIPTLAILTLVEFVRDPRGVVANKQGLGVALASTAGVAFVLALLPSSFFDFVSDREAEMFATAIVQYPIVSSLLTQLKEVRADVVSADAWRSLAVIVTCLGLCYLYLTSKLKRDLFLGLLGLTMLFDLWQVDKRYLNDDKFRRREEVALLATPVHEVNRQIAQDNDPHYRVLNLGRSPFQDATTSYMHRSVGGYHAAKLSRYQDLIEHQISKGNTQVLDMLDVRYTIVADPQGQLTYSTNPSAFGAAWFVDTLRVATTAQQEMQALGEIDLKHTAVVSNDHSPTLDALIKNPRNTSVEDVALTEYTPNRAKYSVDTDMDRLLVFSEIYYPYGWNLSIDGQPAELIRANYLLRATVVPAGRHTVEMVFDPLSIRYTEWVSRIAQIIIALGGLLLLGRTLRGFRFAK